MTQGELFPDLPEPSGLDCYYGTEWLDHFDPPIGTGKGCPFCNPMTETDEPTA